MENKNIIKTNQENTFLLYCLQLMLGFTFICFIIYIRFFFKRLPRSLNCFDLIDDSLHLNYVLVIIIVVGISINSFIVIQWLKLLILKEIKISVFQKIGIYIYEFTIGCCVTFYEFLLKKIPKVEKILTYIPKYFVKYFCEQTNLPTYKLLVIFKIIIRLLLVFIFLIDIFIFFRFYYFYKALILIGILLIIDFILFVSKRYAQEEKKILSKYFNISQYKYKTESGETFVIIDKVRISLKPKYKFTTFSHKAALLMARQTSIRVSCIYIFNGCYEEYSLKLLPFWGILIHTTYIMGWLYIIIINYFIYFSI